MKLKIFLFAATVFFVSCSNDKKTTEIPKQVSVLKSDILIQNTSVNPFSSSSTSEKTYLTLAGKTLLKSTATLQTINTNGEEIACETFKATQLIKPEYKTANTALKEAHLREVVLSYFNDEKLIEQENDALAGVY